MLSGSVQTNSFQTRYLKVSWTATQSLANNSSTVSWTLSAHDGKSSIYYTEDCGVWINGSKVYTRDEQWACGRGTIASGSIVVPHNTDGTKTFTITVQAAVYEWTVNCTGSKSFTLDQIPRGSDWTVDTSVAFGGTMKISFIPKVNSYTHKVTYKFGSYSGTVKTSDDKLFNGISGTAGKTTTKTWTIPLDWLNEATDDDTTYSVRLTCQTYSGSTLIDTVAYTPKLTFPSGLSPTISDFTLTPNNDAANDTVKGWGVWITGITTYNLTATVDLSYNAGITKWSHVGKSDDSTERVLIGSSTAATLAGITNNSDGTCNLSVTGGNVSRSGELGTLEISVTDSRNNVATRKFSSPTTIYAYSEPFILNFIVDRASADNTKIRITAYWFMWEVGGRNTVTAKILYRHTGDTDWLTFKDDISGDASLDSITNAYMVSKVYAEDGDISFPVDSSYEFKLVVTDVVGNTSEANANIATSKVTVHFREGGDGLGIGKYAESDALEIAFPIILYNNGTPDPLDDHINTLIDSTVRNMTKLITESGQVTTSEGKAWYYKLSDGSIIQFGYGSYSTTITNAYGSAFIERKSITFPVPFAEECYYYNVNARWGTGANWTTIANWSTTVGDFYIVDLYKRATAGTVKYKWIAMGV